MSSLELRAEFFNSDALLLAVNAATEAHFEVAVIKSDTQTYAVQCKSSNSTPHPLDGAHLKVKYLGVTLTGIGIDANGSLFPPAMAEVDAEDEENWLWFATQLYKAVAQINEVPALTFLSDRQKGLVNALAQTFPDSWNGFCMRHLTQNYKRKINHNVVVSLIREAASSWNKKHYGEAMIRIPLISPESEQWLGAINPTFWSEASFEGNRFGHYTSNIAESFNASILEPRKKPVKQILERIRRLMMD